MGNAPPKFNHVRLESCGRAPTHFSHGSLTTPDPATYLSTTCSGHLGPGLMLVVPLYFICRSMLLFVFHIIPPITVCLVKDGSASPLNHDVSRCASP
ncbi:hypothetical protein BDA96_09G034700 [Sorghum bicolor]|uniref:Uncharacterized protein n=1 Tax=Sorghum bicolor TaxID=4558 RepID=A0A921U3M9_SORBI|nr:hypothetical protein BDA96_09G034700 [Sorghum bicolor]